MTHPTTKGRPVAKPRALAAEAYCLRLVEDGRWFVVDTSDPSVLGETPADNPPRADVAALGALPAMQEQARRREAFVQARIVAAGEDPDDHVTTFMAATAAEAAEMTGLPLPSKRRRPAAAAEVAAGEPA